MEGLLHEVLYFTIFLSIIDRQFTAYVKSVQITEFWQIYNLLKLSPQSR